MTNGAAFRTWKDVCIAARAEAALALEPGNGSFRVRAIAFASDRSRALALLLSRGGRGFDLGRSTIALPAHGALGEALAEGRSGALDLASDPTDPDSDELVRFASSLGLRNAALAQVMDDRWQRRIGLFLFDRPLDETEVIRVERMVRAAPWPANDDDPFFAGASAGATDLDDLGAALATTALANDIERAYRALRSSVGANRIVVLTADESKSEMEVVAQWPERPVRSAPLVVGIRVPTRPEAMAELLAGRVLTFPDTPTGRTIESAGEALLGEGLRSALYFATPPDGGTRLVVQAAAYRPGHYDEDAGSLLSLALRATPALPTAPPPAAPAPATPAIAIDLVEALADAVDTPTAVDRALSALAEVVEFEAAAVRLCRDDGEHVRILSSRPLDVDAARQLVEATGRELVSLHADHRRCDLREVRTGSLGRNDDGPSRPIRGLATMRTQPILEAGVEGAVAIAGHPGAEVAQALRDWAGALAPALRRIAQIERAMDERLRSVARTMMDGLAIIDDDLRSEPMNEPARAVLARLLVAGPGGRLAEGSWLAYAVRDTIATGTRHAAEIATREGDESRSVWATVGRLATGCAVVLLRDLTDERAAQKRASRATERAVLADVVSGVAHEIANPLTSIVGFAQLLEANLHDEGARRATTTILEEARRAERVIRSLIEYGRPDIAPRAPVDLNACVLRVLRLREYDRRLAGISIALSLTPGLPSALADEDALQRALFALLVNAEEAIGRGEGGGTISVSTEATTSTVLVRISDTGPGIPPEHLSRIFEPFFSTKPPGVATGLGLATAYAAVSEQGGDILVASRPGHGATFTIELPMARTSERPGEARPANAQRLLVIGESEPTARLVAGVLASGGIDTVVATPAGALDLVETMPFDAIIIEAASQGGALYGEIRMRRPWLAARTGFVADGAAARAQAERVGRPYVSTPFRISEVRRLAAELLETPSA